MDATFFIKAGQLILSLSILVVLHELGHFLPARFFKIKIEKFYLFFNPGFSLFKKKIGDTEWGIGWLPLGGYVKIAGMVDESMDTEQLKKPAQPWEFRSKPAWQRLIVMIGGVVVNLILGILIYIGISGFYGSDIIKPSDLKHGYGISALGEKAGLTDGDVVLKIEGVPLEDANSQAINRQLLLRGARNFEVRKADGSIKKITFPVNIARSMFENGETSLFQERSIPIVDTVMPKTPALIAGLKKGDQLIALNGTKLTYYDEFMQLMKNKINAAVTVSILRDGKMLDLKSRTDQNGKLGFSAGMKDMKNIKITHVSYGFGASISNGLSRGMWTLHDYVAQLKYIFTKKGASQIGGFAAMGNMFGAEWNWEAFWNTTALISIILAFMNILPIPALDGGHVVFLLYEMITGKEAPQKVLEYAQMVGIVLLLSLMLYANGNDIYRIFFK
jgi:regulator of sigma E protease